MEKHYLTWRNHYLMDDEDPGLALHGFSKFCACLEERTCSSLLPLQRARGGCAASLQLVKAVSEELIVPTCTCRKASTQ